MTEDMKRLIKDGKIVGYLKITGANIKITTPEQYVNDIWFWYDGNHRADSFDMGIKVGDEWWFDGDNGMDVYDEEFTLVYEPKRVRWCINYPDGDTYSSENMLDILSNAKRIGSTHGEIK